MTEDFQVAPRSDSRPWHATGRTTTHWRLVSLRMSCQIQGGMRGPSEMAIQPYGWRIVNPQIDVLASAR